jgi:hypothetical protein
MVRWQLRRWQLRLGLHQSFNLSDSKFGDLPAVQAVRISDLNRLDGIAQSSLIVVHQMTLHQMTFPSGRLRLFRTTRHGVGLRLKTPYAAYSATGSVFGRTGFHWPRAVLGSIPALPRRLNSTAGPRHR